MTDREPETQPAPEREKPHPAKDAPMATSPKDPVSGQIEEMPGPMERAGTEAEKEARETP